MSLKEKLMDDLKSAMKDKDTIKKDTIQLVRSSILQFEKDNKSTLDDDGVIGIIAKELKQRKDALPDFIKSGRQDLIDRLNTEINTLLTYLPEQLSAEELESIVKDAISKTGALTMKDMGKIMSAVMPLVKGRADGKAINEIAKKLLS